MSILNQGQAGGAGSGSPDAGSGAGGQSGNQTPWYSSLADEYKTNQSVISHKDVNSLVKSYLSAQSMVGADKVAIPGKNATPEQIAEFYTKLGRPEAPDKYTFKLPEGLTEDKLDKARIDTWRKECFEAGLTAAQTERLMSKYIGEEHTHNTASAAQMAKERELWDASLKQKHGAAYDTLVNHAKLGFAQFQSPELNKFINDADLGSHPALVELFAKIGATIGDSRPPGAGGSAGTGGQLTPEQAQHELDQMQRDSKSIAALFNPRDPLHDQIKARRAMLFKVAGGDK